MGSDRSPRYYACEKGHPVLSGSTVCTRCGAQVTDRVVAGPRGAGVTTPVELTPPGITSPPERSRDRFAFVASLGIGVGVLAVASVLIFSAVSKPSSDDQVPPHGPAGSGFLTACGGIAQVEIALNTEYPESKAIVCFTVDEETNITVGATAAGDEDLTLEVRSGDGTFWASADDTNGSDPEITSDFLPGTYVVSVARWGGGEPGAFTLYTRSEVILPSATPVDGTSLADPAQCGTPDLPLLVGSGGLDLTADTPYACVRIETAGFIKFGAIAQEDSAADLRLAVYSFDDFGATVFLNSVDNTFGRDPEMSLDLDPGLYLVDMDSWDGSPLGSFHLYVDTSSTYFRQGEVAPEFSAVTPQDCADGTLLSIAVGQTRAISGGAEPLVCLTLTSTERVLLEAVSPEENDLTLEVIGFASNGTPVRFGWVDYYLWSGPGDDVAQVDLALPAGTYVLAAAKFDGSAAGDVVFTVSTSGG